MKTQFILSLSTLLVLCWVMAVASVTVHAQKGFAGNYRMAFDHYGASGRMDEDGLERLLKDAGVGNFATRGTWTAAIMEKLDGGRDGFISFAEHQFLQ